MEEDLRKRREEAMRAVERVLGLKGRALLAEYDLMSQEYDKYSLDLGWIGTKLAAESIQKYVPNTAVAVLDVCGGTGDVGLWLKDAGYKTVDVLDGSRGMLMVAMRRQIYRNYYCELLGETPADPPTNLRDNLYDLVVMCSGHVSTGKCSEMTRLVKPGGVCVTIVLEGEGDFEGSMAWLEEQQLTGRLKLEERQDLTHLSFDEKNNHNPGHRAVWRRI